MVKINLSILVFCPTIYLATLKLYTKFEDFGSHRCREICDRNNLLERKKNGQIKGMISRRLILSYTIQQVIPNICIKFQNPRFCSSWENFDEKKKFTHIYFEVMRHVILIHNPMKYRSQWPTFILRLNAGSYWFILSKYDVHTSNSLQDIRQNYWTMKYKSRWPTFILWSCIRSYWFIIPNNPK